MKHILSSLLLLGAITLQAQNSLSGKITDTNNNPLIGVEIFSTKLHRGTTSDIDGNYLFKNIPNGTIHIRFVYLGYKEMVKTIYFNSENQLLNLQLEESVFTIDEVIISTPFNKLQSENVMKVERITAASLRKTGATTLSEGITAISGVSQISTGASIGKPVIRGLSGNRVLVYTQGVRLENQQFGGEHGLGLNDQGVESVEVIKGPASLLYGSDALGGVIYVNPEKFSLNNEHQFSFNQRFFSNTLGSSSSIGYKIASDSWKLTTRATSNFYSDYKVPNGQRITNTRFRENDFKIGIGYNASQFSSVFRYNFNHSLLGIPETGIGEQTTSTLPEAPYQKIYNHIFSLHNHFLFKTSKIETNLGYIYNERNEFEEQTNPSLKMKLKTFSYTFKYHLPKFLNGIESIVGLQGMHQTNKNLAEELLIPNAKINDIAVFTTVNYQWRTSSIQAGVRLDTRDLKTEKHEINHDGEIHLFNPLDNNYTSFTASLGYKFEPFRNMTARVNAASGFRAPNLAELTSNGVHHGTNRFEVGNSNLSNEKNIQLDISLEYKTEHLELFGNGFYNHLSNYIYLTPTGAIEDGTPVYNYTQHNARLFGGEVGFHLHPHPIDWLHLESSLEMVIGKLDSGMYLPLIPAHIVKNKLRTEFEFKNWLSNGYLTLAIHSVFKQSNTSLFETKTNGYNLVHLRFGGDMRIKKTNFTASISINNLLNTSYSNHLSRLKSENILNPGRNIVAAINFNL
ncbi:MAG: TonB-dependent receptor [Polaribacter sp.]|nr:TonB-dependent receptor [Polaribacter sp.]